MFHNEVFVDVNVMLFYLLLVKLDEFFLRIFVVFNASSSVLLFNEIFFLEFYIFLHDNCLLFNENINNGLFIFYDNKVL